MHLNGHDHAMELVYRVKQVPAQIRLLAHPLDEEGQT
jgi:hypothetical protein